MSHTGTQTGRMHNPPVRSQVAGNSLPTEHAALRVSTVIATAAAVAAIVCPTLVALTRGWDYRLAILLGALVAVGCLALGRRTLPAGDVAGRLSHDFTAAYAATLFCVYASDWLDWRPLGIDDALAGMAIGLVLLVAGPTRRALHLAASAPGDASSALILLVVVPAGLAYLGPLFGRLGLDDAQAHATAQLAGLGVSLILAWLGTTFAVRRGLLGTGLVLSVLSGLAVLALLDRGGIAFSRATALGALAGAVPVLFVVRAWCAVAFTRSERPDSLLAWLVISSVVSLAVGAWLIAGLTGASALGTWWWFYHRTGLPLISRGAPKRIDGRQSVLSAALTVSWTVFNFVQGSLLVAAAGNLTGPMLLAAIGESGLYRVSELTFAEALLADQYLWRDEPTRVRRIAAASPERLLRLLRHERDNWSYAETVSAWRAEADRKPKGTGLVFGPGPATDGWPVSYVYPGSPGDAAGVRRGDVIRAVNGTPIDALGTASPAKTSQPANSTRFELASPGRETREVTIARGEYSRPVVIVQKTFDEAGRRVGYVALEHFLGAAGEEFLNAAVRLHEQGIDELVLDLRTNSGGSLGISRLIGSALGGRGLDGRTFLRLAHNERYRDRDEDIPFRAPKAVALSLQRLFVITSEDTCSASEALINGLAPYMTVVTVGTTTCGKPVGMSVVEYGERAYSVITFRALNARGEGDYFSGLRPTCRAEDDLAHDLGDPAEASLHAALHYIRFGRCPDPLVNAPATH
jgi:C-terminal processing protease CtpA/Prc